MRFHMFSDLHLAEHHGVDTAKPLLKKFCQRVRAEIPTDELVLLIFMGDLIQKGAADAFQTVREVLDEILADLQNYAVSFEFLPGNHDLTAQQLLEFDSLIKEYGTSHAYMEKSVYSKVYDDVNFIFADSNLTRNYKKPGQIDTQAICSEIKKGMENLLFCHHGFTHSLGGDHDCVINGWALSKELHDAGIGFLFHGHTHRADRSIFTELMTEFGCGSISQDRTEMQEGVCHQFSTGYLRDGKLIQVDRWIAQVDGNGSFAHETLYPEPRRFADPDSIGKIDCPPVKLPYLERRVLARESMQGNHAAWLSSIQSISLLDAWNADHWLILLGDAGQGKSVELQDLAYKLNKTGLFPFRYALRDYTGGPIDELLPKEYRDLNPSHLALIFDAYDELSADVHRTFEKELNAWTKKNTLARVLISSRENFCKSEESNQSRTFPGFAVYDLCPLSQEDISNYLDMMHVETNTFFAAVHASQTESLLETPFYLSGIVEIFCQDGTLPNRADIMRCMIQRSFMWDDERYIDGLEDRQYELFNLMEKVSLAMQLMRTNGLKDGSAYQRLFSREQRELIRQSGLLTKSVDIWRFTHNNFREYLTARHLEKLSLEEAVSYFSVEGEVKQSWLNTLGYLISLWPDNTLANWLIEHAPGAVVKFETDRVDESIRPAIFERLFLQYAEKDLIFSNDLCGEKELARFSCCPQTIDFLLEQIASEKKSACQYNALRILQFVPQLFDRREKVLYRLLVYCAETPETMAYSCRLAIHAIYRLGLASGAATDRLLHLFGSSANDYIRLAMYEYLIMTNQQDAYVLFFLDGIQYAEHSLHGEFVRIANERMELQRGLLEMSTPKSVTCVLEWFTEHPHGFYFDGDSIFARMAQKAVELYGQGEEGFFPLMVKCCLWANRHGEHRKEHSTISFFRDTGTLYSAAVSIIHTPPDQRFFLSNLFQTYPELFDCAERAYLEGEFQAEPELFRTLVSRCVKDEVHYNRCAKYIWEREGFEMPEAEFPVDYDTRRRKSCEMYFSVLFDRGMALELQTELVKRMGNIAVAKLNPMNLDVELDSPLLLLLYAILRNVPGEVMVKDALSHVDWDYFFITEAADMLRNHRDVQPTPEQGETLCAGVCEAIEKGAFQNAVEYAGESSSIPLFVHDLIFLAMYLDCDIRQEFLLQLTEIPEGSFEEDGKSSKYAYLARKLPLERLTDKIIEDLSANRVRNSVLQDHIEYCGRIQSDGAIEAARRLCTEGMPGSSSRHAAFKYLYERLGKSYVESEIIPIADGELLCHIANSYSDISQSILEDAMEQMYQMAPTLSLQRILISFGNENALKKYADTVCERCALPEGEPEFEGSTSAVATVCNPHFLPLLGNLLETALSPDFKDREFDGLLRSVTQAFLNCGKEDTDTAISEVKRHLPDKCNDEKRSRRCNYIIEELLRIKRTNFDVPWSIRQVESIMNGL